MDIRNSASSKIFFDSTSTSLGVRSVCFFRSGGKCGFDAFSPTPKQYINSVAERSRGHFYLLVKKRIFRKGNFFRKNKC